MDFATGFEFDDALWLRFGVALGIGLLIGVERERRKGEGRGEGRAEGEGREGSDAQAGVRTFALTALAGAIAFVLGGALLLAVAALGIAAFAALGYSRRHRASGLTSEISLLLTLLLGALALRQPALAAGLGVTVALLLAARTPIHHFARGVLTEAELHDGLVLAGSALVVLPLMPDRYVGPFAAINPHALWTIVVLMLALNAAGHIGLRIFGPRFGLPLAGFISGFVSSALTISSMGRRTREQPALMPAAVAGAVLSSVATVVQMVLILAATSLATFAAMAPALVCAGAAALFYGVLHVWRSLHLPVAEQGDLAAGGDSTFSFLSALGIALTFAVVMFGAAAFNALLGTPGTWLAVAVAGFVDTHSPAVSIASLVAADKLAAQAAVLPILLALSTNALTKMVLAGVAGGRAYAMQIIPGLVLMIGGAWLGAWWSGALA